MASELSLLKNAVGDVLGLQGTAAEEQANAEAEQLKNQGSQGEIDSYNRAAEFADKNAVLEGTLGDIREYQTQRQVGKTMGEQQAAIAGAGFTGDSGTAVALLRESLQQGYLGTQLQRTQTQQNQAGYLEQASAARAEGKAVQSQIDASNRLADAQANAAQIASANAAAESSALTEYIKANPAQTPEEQAGQDLVTSTLRSPLNGPASLPATVDPKTADTASGPTSFWTGQFGTLGQGEPLGLIDRQKPSVQFVVQGG